MSDRVEREQPLTLKQLEERAIQEALQGKWEQAEEFNLLVLQRDPENVGALNRLGKALLELGRYEEAQDAYRRALEIDPYNRIARKNLQRLEVLIREAVKRARTETGDRGRILPDLFISESGKSAVVPLRGMKNIKTLLQLSRGEIVHLESAQETVVVKDEAGVVLGRLDARVSRRLADLIQAGNRYVAAIAEVTEDGAKVFVRETFQHPSLVGRLSFPPIDAGQRTEIVRPYMRDWGLRFREELEIKLSEDEDEEEEEDLEELGMQEEGAFEEDYDDEDLEDDI